MKRFADMKIARKMIVGFLVVALVAALVGVVGIVNVLGISRQDTQLYRQDTLGLQYTGELGLHFQQLRYYIMQSLTLENDTEIAENIEATKQLFLETIESFDRFQKEITLGDDSETEKLVTDLKSSLEIYEDYLDMHIVYLEKGMEAQTAIFAHNTMGPIGDQIREDLNLLMSRVAAHAEQMARRNFESAMRAIIMTVVFLVISVVVALFLGSRIARVISKPVMTMTELGKLLATGDINLDKVLSDNDSLKNRKDEVGELAAAFEDLIATTKEQVRALQMLAEGDLRADLTLRSDSDALGKALNDLTDNLNNLLAAVVLAADQVTSGALAVSNSSMVLSQGATEQAASIQELTASLDEIADQTEQNARNAEKANALAANAKINAEDGNTQMKGMLQAMDDISTSSGNINKIIKVIEDIAFQTNILALNASVEAARAGQHGRGFAVVAEEVRTLAAKSANAAKETTELIENSIRKVEAGTRIAQSTADALDKIVDQVDKAAALVNAISEASSQQSIGIRQINEGIMQVSQVVQSNAATAEEGAAASQELSAQAEQLMQTIGIFKTKKFIKTANQFSAGGKKAGQMKTISLEAPKTAASAVDFGKY